MEIFNSKDDLGNKNLVSGLSSKPLLLFSESDNNIPISLMASNNSIPFINSIKNISHWNPYSFAQNLK